MKSTLRLVTGAIRSVTGRNRPFRVDVVSLRDELNCEGHAGSVPFLYAALRARVQCHDFFDFLPGDL